jgi:hypothetical protein
MRVYTVHVPPFSHREIDPVLIKEGFSWPAFLFGPLWMLIHRLWLAFVVLVVVTLILGVAADAFGLGEIPQAIVSLAIAVLVGAHGNDMRRHGLARRGYRDAGVVAARNLDEAIHRFVDAEAPVHRSAQTRPRATSVPVAPPPMPISGF